jgi:nucleoside-diphosphate-sugar epimerase
MDNILIVGASGYLGTRISYQLAKKGKNITALCFPDLPIDKEWCSLMKKVIVRDIRSNSVIDEITSEFYDSVIYLVSLNHHDSKKNPSFVNSINVLPVWELLNSFNNKNTLKKFIYFSTVQVYGRLNYKIINEETKTQPENQYALTHLMAENITSYYNLISSINCINIRLSNSYGSPVFKNCDCWWLVVNNLCKDVYYNNKIIIKSDGTPLRDFIHYYDILNSLEYLLDKNLKSSDSNIYNISSENVLSILEIAQLVKIEYEKRYSKTVHIELEKNDISKTKINQLKKYRISNEKIRNLGFKSKISIGDGINEIFDYFENN